MIKEIKYFIFVITIFFFIFFLLRYYFSEENIKKSYRSLDGSSSRFIDKEKDLNILVNDTDNIIEYIKNDKNKNQKQYFFLELLNKND